MDNWKIFISSLKTFHVVALLPVFFIVWKCPVKILTVTSNQMSTLNTTTWNYVVILKKNPKKMDVVFINPTVKFGQTRLLQNHRPGPNFIFLQSWGKTALKPLGGTRLSYMLMIPHILNIAKDHRWKWEKFP